MSKNEYIYKINKMKKIIKFQHKIKLNVNRIKFYGLKISTQRLVIEKDEEGNIWLFEEAYYSLKNFLYKIVIKKSKKFEKMIKWQKNFTDLCTYSDLKNWEFAVYNYANNLEFIFKTFYNESYKWESEIKHLTEKQKFINYKKIFIFYVYLYFTIIKNSNLSNFKYFKYNIKKKTKTPFHFILNFSKNKLFTIIKKQNKNQNYNLSCLSTGLFIKFFAKNKSLRKNKLIKTLLMRFIRKLLLILNINLLILIVKRTPVLLNELIFIFQKPILLSTESSNKYMQLEEFKKIIKEGRSLECPVFTYFLFTKSKSYVKNKIKKKEE